MPSKSALLAILLAVVVSTMTTTTTTAIPLLQIGHHPLQQEIQRRERRVLFHDDEDVDTEEGEGTGMTNLDGADCNTSSIPQQLIRLENTLTTGRCVMEWEETRSVTGGRWYYYPNDFEGITNQVEHYVCPAAEAADGTVRNEKRVFFSNGFPDHSVRWGNPNTPCEKFWYIEMPANPVYNPDRTLEPPSGGIVAIALNGVPIYGAQEAQAVVGNALEPDESSEFAVFDARFWYGHSTGAHVAHYHNPAAGTPFVPSEETLLGYALDGFPLYGPLENDDELDNCNGRMVDGSYQYHVRTLDQVDETLAYCPADQNLNKPYIAWNYIVGCYHGDASETVITAYSEKYLEDLTFPTNSSFPYPNCEMVNANTESTDEVTNESAPKPNIIIMQPDDLPFYDGWGPPPNNPGEPGQLARFPANFTLPSIERLRTQGVQLRQAYAASSACGTSRFSTLTGKYPSRAVSNDSENTPNKTLAKVTIPKTKLIDIDCSSENLAAALKNSASYRTGVVGKWHLFPINETTYTYGGVQEAIRNCGFDFAEGIYPENLSEDTSDILGNEHHNMEWLASKAIDFIQEDSDDPFVLYFNPTVPHSGGSVWEALNQSCRDTPGGTYVEDFIIKGMTLEYGNCESYRDFVRSRAFAADGDEIDPTDPGYLQELGAIWLDDAVGALIHALVDKGIFDNTIIIFQQDHGLEAKNSLFENGGRIAQFVHYPDFYGTEGSESHSLVSTIDIAPTLMDFAGITPPYELDGQSWRFAVKPDAEPGHVHFFEKQRCLFFEYQRDRAVRCGCAKLMRLSGVRSTFSRPSAPTDNDEILAPTAAPTTLDEFTEGSATFEIGIQGQFFDGSVTDDNPTFLYDLCTGDEFFGDYITADIAEEFDIANPEAEDLLDSLRMNNYRAVRQQLQEVILCFNSITDATLEPTFDRNCSLETYFPVCKDTLDCRWGSFGRTTCSAGFCNTTEDELATGAFQSPDPEPVEVAPFEEIEAGPAEEADPVEEVDETGLLSTNLIFIVAVAALAVFLAAMFLRCIAIVICKPER